MNDSIHTKSDIIADLRLKNMLHPSDCSLHQNQNLNSNGIDTITKIPIKVHESKLHLEIILFEAYFLILLLSLV